MTSPYKLEFDQATVDVLSDEANTSLEFAVAALLNLRHAKEKLDAYWDSIDPETFYFTRDHLIPEGLQSMHAVDNRIPTTGEIDGMIGELRLFDD